MNPYKIDIPVLLIFFNRPETFSKVFEQVRLAKPSILYLYQDGPRLNNESDLQKILACRRIAENIDWDCKVYTLYQEKNVGCDPSEFIAQKWMFSKEDMGIVLEDDDVPSQSFFPFCKELLEKYENDTRISRICGMNTLDEYDSKDSYLFTYGGSIWGWASWKRVVSQWDEKYTFLADTAAIKLLEEKYAYADIKNFLITSEKHRESGKAYYESIFNMHRFLSSGLSIVPTKNMISNIGITDDSTHATGDIRLIPHGIRRVFNQKTYEIQFPLKHPSYVIENVDYLRKQFRIMGFGHPLVCAYRKMESLCLHLRYGDFKWFAKKLKNLGGSK